MADGTRSIEVHCSRHITAGAMTALWSGIAAALTVGNGWTRRAHIVVEVIVEAGEVRHVITAPIEVLPIVEQHLSSQLPAVRWSYCETPVLAVDVAIEVRLTNGQRSARVDRAGEISTAVLMALTAVHVEESAVLQAVLVAAPATKATHRGTPRWPKVLTEPAEVRLATGDNVGELKQKDREPQVLGVIRTGLRSTDQARRHHVLKGIVGAFRGADAPGVRTAVRRWPNMKLRLERRLVPLLGMSPYNGAELAARIPFPIAGPQVPGLTLGGSRLLVPSKNVSDDSSSGAMLAVTTFPGVERPIVLPDVERLSHSLILGGTGSGKSTLLAHMAIADIERGHGVVLLDPKADVVEAVLDRLPPHRVKDVIVIDPADEERPVGYNPLAIDGRGLDLMADGATANFSAKYKANWGPRTDDLMRTSIISMASVNTEPDQTYTLCELPALLTDKAFRRSITSRLNDPIVLEPFWSVYESMRPNERAQVISPLMNKLRAFILRNSLRAMLGQSNPKWSIEQVMADRKILLVSLRSGVIGEESAQLLGGLLVARIWQATLARAVLPPEQRHPVMVIIDEFPGLIGLPTSLGELLAQARGLGVSITLAGQHLHQAPPELRHDVIANCRTKVLFQLGIEDARTFARGLPQLDPEDLQEMPPREVVISLAHEGAVQPPVTGRTLPLAAAFGTAEAAREYSRQTYGVDRSEVEASLLARRGRPATTPKERKASTQAPPRSAFQIGDVPDDEVDS